ncbi:MAG: sulfatase-like hydrolase/transferase [Bacteroidales bacterium]|nr:sulfatase-like hydrolase/transferase [Bacteroidales bacterium]
MVRSSNKAQESRFFGNIYFVLVARLAVSMLLFSLCRVIFYLLNGDLYPGMTFGHFLYLMAAGLKFDLTAVLYTNIAYIFCFIMPFWFRYRSIPQRIFDWIYYVTNALALALNCVDFIYFRYTMRRTTWNVVNEFSNDAGNAPLMGRFLLDFWYVVVIWMALIALMVWLYKRVKTGKQLIRNRWIFYPVQVVVMALIVYLTVNGIRGGFRHSTRPITISNAAQYVNTPAEVGIVLNTPFSIYRTLTQEQFERLTYFQSQEEMTAIYSPVHYPKKADSVGFTPKNVVIIIVESLSQEYVGGLNKESKISGYKGYTPFLDSLINESLVFEYSFANGRKSIDAMPSILASIPSLSTNYVLSIYANNAINGLPALLKTKGYDCSFMHGAPNGSMGFQAFANMAGFDHYYGRTEYGNNADFDGWWGIWDEPFLQYCVDVFNSKPQPFMSSIFTVSSHHPFVLPPQYEGVFPEGAHPIHRTVGYTDYALRRFFESASQAPWFRNTVFVITADHTNASVYDEYKTFVGMAQVPMIFYEPGNETIKGVKKEEVIQQIDIMPTLLNYLNFDQPYFAFGMDAFDTQNAEKRFAINTLNDFYMLYEGYYVLKASDDKATALYNFHSDRLLTENLLNSEPERAERMYNKLKSFRQQYNDRMIDDDLSTPEQTH